MSAQEALGNEIEIDWSQPRLILIAESFSEYDKYAVNRIGANIELWSYHRYGENFLYLEPLFVTNQKTIKPNEFNEDTEKVELPIYLIDDHINDKPESTKELFEQLRERIIALAEDQSDH